MCGLNLPSRDSVLHVGVLHFFASQKRNCSARRDAFANYFTSNRSGSDHRVFSKSGRPTLDHGCGEGRIVEVSSALCSLPLVSQRHRLLLSYPSGLISLETNWVGKPGNWIASVDEHFSCPFFGSCNSRSAS